MVSIDDILLMFICSPISTGRFLLTDRSLVRSCWGPTWRWAHYYLFTARGRHSKNSGVDLKTFQRLPSVNVLADACGFPCFRVCYDALSHTTIPYNHISPAQSRFPCFIFGMHGKVHRLKWEHQVLPKVPWQPLPGFYTFFVGSFITGS